MKGKSAGWEAMEYWNYGILGSSDNIIIPFFQHSNSDAELHDHHVLHGKYPEKKITMKIRRA
ncbi:MAG: hypothetical protein AB7T27_10805 [Kiritimatiellia bacterium]